MAVHFSSFSHIASSIVPSKRRLFNLSTKISSFICPIHFPPFILCSFFSSRFFHENVEISTSGVYCLPFARSEDGLGMRLHARCPEMVFLLDVCLAECPMLTKYCLLLVASNLFQIDVKILTGLHENVFSKLVWIC